MGIKHKKLMQWVEAGLLSESQADAIQSFENKKKSGRFGRGMVGAGIFAILVGVLSIIASNWHYIPGEVKIGVHVLLNLFIGYAAFQSAKAGKDIWREGYALGFFGLTLTLIALIGQVFQLDGETAKALTLWMIITLPFMLLYGESRITVVPWMVAFLVTLGYALFYYTQDLPDYWQGVVVTAICIFTPLAMMAKGVFPLFKNWKPVWADMSLRTGAMLMAASATMVAIIMGFDRIHDMPEDVRDEYWQTLNVQRLICLAALAGIGLHAFLHNMYRDHERMKLGAIFAAVSLGMISFPLVFVEFHNPVFGAILFIGYWAFIGWLGQKLDESRLISLAIAMIAIRIFVVYLEVFGSLMETGFGLIIGGLIVLGLIWAARKMNKRLTGGEGAPS